MKTILSIIIAILALVPCTFAQKNDTSILFDFNSKETSGNWYIINDDVMGGISRSDIKLQDDAYVNFQGVVSPENNGGFASARAKIEIGSEKNYKGVIIRVRGDGKKYSLRFRTNTNFDGYAYQAKFQSEKDSWVEYKIPFSDFEPTYRGRTLSNKPNLESKNIEQIGVLIADYQFGPFSLDIDWIKLY
jgi:monofunctional biosynthetic peptidoglycan transglycosylase